MIENVKSEFPLVEEALIEEIKIKKTNKLTVSVWPDDDTISLQFDGYEIVLSDKGTYHIFDTTGG